MKDHHHQNHHQNRYPTQKLSQGEENDAWIESCLAGFAHEQHDAGIGELTTLSVR